MDTALAGTGAAEAGEVPLLPDGGAGQGGCVVFQVLADLGAGGGRAERRVSTSPVDTR